ncbi:septation protein IspZ, partial [Francisella tularensis]
GTLNLFVAYFFSTDIWMDFKLFGLLGITFVFLIIQSIYLSKHIKR